MRPVPIIAFFVLLSIAVFAPIQASEGFDDLANLIKVGVTDEVVLAFIDGSSVAYKFNDDETQYLTDLGASTRVMEGALSHGRNLSAPVATVTPTDAANQVPVPGTPALTAVSVTIDDTNPAIGAPADGDVNISYFYKALTPFGRWIDVDGESVWQPESVKTEPGWRPYCNHGNWVSTDQGWAWNSDYEWGWAPFHYGRWMRHASYGYVWTPGTTWAPAWVTWRESDTHCGWAPLPPDAQFEDGVGLVDETDANFEYGLQEADYCFVGTEHFCDAPYSFLYTGLDFHLFFGRTHHIHHSCVVKNAVVFVNGPSVAKVSIAIGKPVKLYAISDAKFRAGETIQGSKVTGDRFTAFRPTVRKVAPLSASVFVSTELKNDAVKKFTGLRNVTVQNHSVEPNLQKRIADADAKRLERQGELNKSKGEHVTPSTANSVNVSENTDSARIKRVQEADAKRVQRQTNAVKSGNESHPTQTQQGTQVTQQKQTTTTTQTTNPVNQVTQAVNQNNQTTTQNVKPAPIFKLPIPQIPIPPNNGKRK